MAVGDPGVGVCVIVAVSVLVAVGVGVPEGVKVGVTYPCRTTWMAITVARSVMLLKSRFNCPSATVTVTVRS